MEKKPKKTTIYPSLSGMDGKPIQASRFSYELHIGEVPKHLYICHTCDNPECCNPKHLFLGTHQDNMDDMIEKGRGYWQKSTNIEFEVNKVEARFLKELLQRPLLNDEESKERTVIREDLFYRLQNVLEQG